MDMSSSWSNNAILARKVATSIAAASNLGENEKLRTSMQYIDTFYDRKNNTIEQRRDLQGVLEKKALEAHEMVLNEFMKVNDQLSLLNGIVSELENTCDSIDQRLNKNRQQNLQFLALIKQLNEEIQDIEKQQNDAKQFLEQFQLTEKERNVIIGGKVDGVFFNILKKVHDIYTQCTELLRNEQQKAGLEILEEMSNYQDIAYERLSRWIQSKCKYLALSDYSNIGSNFFDNDDNLITDPEEIEIIVEEELKCALEALSERPVLLNCCLEEIRNAREKSLVQRFFEALTKGNNRGTSRPIDLQAHDPLHYIGDILAWIHQSAAAERELIDNILSMNEHKAVDNGSSKVTNNFSKTKISLALLDRIFAILNPHLKNIVQQVLAPSNKESPVVYFRVAHLLELYSFTIGKILGEKSAMSLSLLELRSQSMNKFFQALDKDVKDIAGSDTEILIPADLSTPENLKDLMEKLSQIMNTYSQSVVAEERREEDFNQVLSRVIDPLLQKLAQLYEEKKNLDMNGNVIEYTPTSPTSNLKHTSAGTSKKSIKSLNMSSVHVFLINCYFLMQNSLGNFSFTTKKVEQIISLMDRHVELFIAYQADLLLKQCGLKDMITQIKNHSGLGTPLSQIEGLRKEVLANFMKQFYENLFSLGSNLLIPQSQCYQINSARLRMYTQNRITTELVNGYSLLYQVIHDPWNQYQNPQEIAYHTPQQVITLLEF